MKRNIQYYFAQDIRKHHLMGIMELGHLLTHSDVTHQEVSLKFSADSSCLFVCGTLLSWIICYFWHYVDMLHPDSSVVLHFSKLGLYFLPLQSLYSFDNLSKCTLFTFLKYFISAALILLPFLVLMVHCSVPHKTGQPGVLED